MLAQSWSEYGVTDYICTTEVRFNVLEGIVLNMYTASCVLSVYYQPEQVDFVFPSVYIAHT